MCVTHLSIQFHGWTWRTLCSVTYASDNRTHSVGFHVYEDPGGVGVTETESRWGAGAGDRCPCLTGTECQIGKMQRSGDGGDGCTPTCLSAMPLSCHLTVGRWGFRCHVPFATTNKKTGDVFVDGQQIPGKSPVPWGSDGRRRSSSPCSCPCARGLQLTVSSRVSNTQTTAAAECRKRGTRACTYAAPCPCV